MKTLLLSVLFLILGSTVVSAASSYPVLELDNCPDARECHLYCEVPANRPACWAYSQLLVLGDATPSAALVFPIAQLGNCQNRTACKAYCEVAEHRVACAEFARLHSLGKPHPAASLVEKAKAELGCDSLPACRAVCEQATNKDKCKAFTLKFAPQAIRNRVDEAEKLVQSVEKALGCTSKEGCVQFCRLSANKSRCEAFLKSRLPVNKLELEREKLKANCTTAEECRAWCVAHPGLCPGFPNLTPKPTLLRDLPTINPL